MDGLLVIDKPVGPTSHDVVARVRRLLGERRVGHTGTLDPLASGVLPLVVGRATRLARFLSGASKRYDATVRLGISTDTYDIEGSPAGTTDPAGPLPSRDEIERALDAFRGTFMQQPPAFSAKKIGGVRSYELARAGRGSEAAPPPAAPPVEVSATITVVECAGSVVRLDVIASAGFYVRSLAHDLGQRLGVGAHLAALRRMASGGLTIADAVALPVIEADPQAARDALVPMSQMLPEMAAMTLTPDGVKRACQGRELGPADFTGPTGAAQAVWRLLDAHGDLVGVAEPSRTPGLLHPAVVLM
jgi:tRNA pseudouridine55 synthase